MDKLRAHVDSIQLVPLLVGFTTSNNLFSRLIRIFETRWAPGSFMFRKVPSHVFLINKIGDSFFAAEMIDSGLQLDEPLSKYEKRGELIMGYKSLPFFHNEDGSLNQVNIDKAVSFLADLKANKIKGYGWEDILRQIGLPLRDSDQTLICSELAEVVVRLFGFTFGFGLEPNPLQVYKSSLGKIL
jgi:hypothetical protein